MSTRQFDNTANLMTRRLEFFVLAPAILSATVLWARQNPPGTAVPPQSAAAVTEGARLFDQSCQSCHGPAGQGSDRGLALATAPLVHGSTDADLFRAIRAGVPGTQMPPFAGMSDAE